MRTAKVGLDDRVENAPLGSSGRLGTRQFDPIAETSEFPDHSGCSALLGLLANRWAAFLVTDSPMQDLPDQAAKPVGDHTDRLIMPQARHIAAIEVLEDAPFVLDRRVGGLIEKAPQGAVPLGRPVAAAHSRRLVVAGAGAHPRGEVSRGVAAVGPTWAIICCAESTPRPGTSASRSTWSW